MRSRTNETSRRGLGRPRRIYSTAVAAAVAVCVSIVSVALAAPPPSADRVQAKAERQLQHAMAKQQRATAAAQHVQQRTAAKPQGLQPNQQRARSTPAASSGAASAAAAAAATAAPVARATAPAGGSTRSATIAAFRTPTGRPAQPASTRAARRAAIHRRALARRRAAAGRAAARATLTGPATGDTALAAAVTAPPAAGDPPRNGSAHPAAGTGSSAPAADDPHPSRGPVTVVTHTVRDIAHVIPGWAKALMLALAALLAAAALIILATALRNRHLRALSARLLDEVGTLSTALMPTIPARVGALGVSVAYRPAEGLAAGGDFYDVFPLEQGRVGIVVGDVSGHGRESLGPATFIRHMVRSYLEAGLLPRAALQLAGRVVDEHNGDDFATVIAAVHDPGAGTLSYASAGHPPPIVTGPAAHDPLIAAAAPPLGVGSATGLRQTTLPLTPGSRVCFFTDGLFEARRGERIIGMPRLEQIVHELGPDATAEELIARVTREAESMPDDVAVCLVRADGGVPVTSTVRVEEIEVTGAELRGPRVARFLQACGLAPDEVKRILESAQPHAAKYGSILLRVRLAENRSGVDVLPLESSGAGAELTPLRQTS